MTQNNLNDNRPETKIRHLDLKFSHKLNHMNKKTL